MRYLEHMEARLSGEEDYVPGFLGAKRRVREFAQTIGIATPKQHYRGPIESLPDDLPERFVLKPEFASTSIGVLLLERITRGSFRNVVTGIESTRQSLMEYCTDIASAHYKQENPEAVFVVEELLRGADGSTPPPDVRCYCFQGEIGMILTEHHITGQARAMYFDGNFVPFDDLDERYSISDYSARTGDESIESAVPPKNARAILNVARRISSAVPSAFCRVDLYDTDRGVVLGELTFYPGTFYYKNRKIMLEKEDERLGRLWDQAQERLRGSVEVTA